MAQALECSYQMPFQSGLVETVKIVGTQFAELAVALDEVAEKI